MLLVVTLNFSSKDFFIHRQDVMSTGTTGDLFEKVAVKVEKTYSPPALISVSEFAGTAGITGAAVRKMITERRIHAIKIGSQHSIPKEELENYLSSK